MSQIRIITETIDGDVVELDVDQGVKIVLKKTFLSLTDIDQRRGDFTQSFGLPRSPTNDVFFGQFGDPSTFSEDWDTRIEAPAFILENDNIVIAGILKMVSSTPQLNRYNISISGNVATIKSILGESEMANLDMSPWIYTPGQIYSTWSRSIFSGDMVFPIHDFGFGWGLYKKATTGNVLQDFTNSATPIILDQTIPAFRLTKLLTMIFEEQGFTVEGSFFSETSVDEIYVQADNALTSFAVGASLFTAQIITKTVIDSTLRIMSWGANPTSADFNNSTNRYTAPIAGTYYFDMNFNPSPGSPGSNICAYSWYKNGVYSGIGGNFDWGGSVSVTGQSFVLAAGDYLDIRVQAIGAYSVAGAIFAGSSHNWDLKSVVASGSSVDPSQYWANHKQIDFFRGIVQIFNLIPWINEDNKIVIDTWEYYMENYGSKKDWTGKIDATSISVKPINGELRNPVNLSLSDADNILNTDYKNQVGRNYGSYNEDQGIPGTLPEQPNIKKFSPAAIQEIDPNNDNGANLPKVMIAKYYANNDSLAYKSPGLQLMYYNGTRGGLSASIYTTDSAGGATTARTIYPYFSNFLHLTPYSIVASTLDLNFTWWTPPSVSMTVTAPSEQGLFNRYFREMIRERYDEAVKVVEFNALLDAVDIAGFNFADTIIANINGTPVGLRIIEIKD